MLLNYGSITQNTPNGSIQKGVPTTVTLSKTSLFTIANAFDLYSAAPSNAKKAIVIYQSKDQYGTSVGQQKVALHFDLSQESPTATFFVSPSARDTFQLERIVINDFDGGELSFSPTEISHADQFNPGIYSEVEQNLWISFDMDFWAGINGL